MIFDFLALLDTIMLCRTKSKTLCKALANKKEFTLLDKIRKFSSVTEVFHCSRVATDYPEVKVQINFKHIDN